MTTGFVLAAAAAAYVLWSRPPSTYQPQPLSPIAPPGLAPLGAPEAGGGGPHPLTLIAILMAGAMVAFAIRDSRKDPAPPPMPSPIAGIDLVGKFVGDRAAEDAAITAELLDQLASVIEWDGLQEWNGSPKSPRLKTGQQLAELRSVAREYRTSGVSLGDRQPLARDEIAAYLDKEVGNDGGPIDTAGRARWIRAFRAISASARAASGGRQ